MTGLEKYKLIMDWVDRLLILGVVAAAFKLIIWLATTV